MKLVDQQRRTTTPSAGRFWPVLLVLLAVVVFLLWNEHRVHLLGALPYLILLACPLMHVFMHGGHGHSHGSGRGSNGHGGDKR